MLSARTPRRGVAAVLAMLYLVLFSALAIGFYAATTMSAQITHNDKRAALAQMAAESGMDFVRYQLANVSIPHGTPTDQLFPTMFVSLQQLMDSTGNLTRIEKSGEVISIPAGGGSVTLNSGGSSFRATITNAGQKVRVRVVGWHIDPTLARAITMDFGPAEKASRIFDYGIASKGKVVTDGVSRIRGATDPTKGSILSTTMSQPTPVEVKGKEVSGDVSITNPNGNVLVGSGASIGGTTDLGLINSEHVQKGVPEPEFPTIDTSAFAAYATNVYAGGNTVINARIPAGTNPVFAAGATLQGVVLIEMPNTVTFRGNTNVQGVVIVGNNPAGDLSTNLLDFRGNITATGVETLPASFGDLRKLTGAVILAPNVHVRFSGNFGEINGHLLASKFTFDGNASGTIKGSIVNLNDTTALVKGSSEIIIASTGTMNYPAGVFFSSHYVPLADTYTEVLP